MLKKYLILLLIIPIVIFTVLTYDQDSVYSPEIASSPETVPTSETFFGTTAELSLSRVPNLNEEFQLTLTVGVAPQLNRTFENLTAHVTLSEGFALLGGDLNWQGDLEPGETVQIVSTIKATQTGELTIVGSVKGMSDVLYLTVSESGSTVSRTPHPITASSTAQTEVVKITLDDFTYEFPARPASVARTGNVTLP